MGLLVWKSSSHPIAVRADAIENLSADAEGSRLYLPNNESYYLPHPFPAVLAAWRQALASNTIVDLRETKSEPLGSANGQLDLALASAKLEPIDWARVPSAIRSDLMEWAEGNDEIVKTLSREEAWEAYLEWNGILGYGQSLLSAAYTFLPQPRLR